MMGVLFGMAAGIFCSYFCFSFYYHKKESRLFSRLQHMLDSAIAGDYAVSDISEEKISLFENTFKRYLEGSERSVEKQKEQKEVVQKLISDIAHQTLTPISNLKLYTGLLEENCGENKFVSTISEETEKLDFLVQSLVKLSRMENGIIAVHPKETPLNELLSAVWKNYKNSAEQKKLNFTAARTEGVAVFDLKWTIEAVGNIVDNAIKYTPEGGAVAITVQQYSFFARIDISDTGIGIREEEIPKIFTRFYRSPDVAKLPGVGIGLYLSRYMTEQQRGYIKVKSGKGKGTVFSVFLPVEAEN